MGGYKQYLDYFTVIFNDNCVKSINENKCKDCIVFYRCHTFVAYTELSKAFDKLYKIENVLSKHNINSVEELEERISK